MEDRSLQIKIITFLMIAIPIVIISYVFIWENASQRKAAEILELTERNTALITVSDNGTGIKLLKSTGALLVLPAGRAKGQL